MNSVGAAATSKHDLPSRVARLCLLLLLGISTVTAIHALAAGWMRLHIHHQLDYEEGNILNTAVLITHGQTPYPPLQSWPIVINPYGPIGYYLTSLPVSMKGPNFVGPRAVVLFCALLCGLFTGLIAYEPSRSRLAAGIAAALFLSHSIARYWMPILRVDFIGLAFTLAGVWVSLHFPRRWPIAVALFTAAIFTKPTFVAAPFACFVVLLIKREFRKATKFALMGVALGAAAFLAMQFSTHGAFAFYIFHSHPDPWLLSHFIEVFHYLLLGNPILTIVAAIALGLSLARRNFDFLTIYAICVLLASISAGKLGSNDNHLLEFAAVLCIFGSAALVRWSAASNAVSVAVSSVCVLISIWMVLQIPYGPNTTPQRGCIIAYDIVRQSPSDRILSEDVGSLVLAGKPVWVSNPFVFGQLINAGKWSDDAVASRIRSHWFDLIVLSDDASQYTERWSPPLLEDIRQNYHLAARLPCQDANALYVPNRTANDSTATH